MPIHGARLWDRHPAVRTGDDLTVGERAADRLKAAFGSWTFLIVLNLFIAGWIGLNAVLPRAQRWDVFPFILLNLGLSWLAAQQGGALQIAANRGDRINAEIALDTHKMAKDLLGLNERQIEILTRLDGLDGKVADLTGAIRDVLAAHLEHDSAVLTEVKAGRSAAESAFVATQVLAASATGPQPALKDPEVPAAGPKAARGMGRRIPPKAGA